MLLRSNQKWFKNTAQIVRKGDSKRDFSPFLCGIQAKLREVASLEGHVLLKKLRDALESLRGHFAGRNKEDVEKAIFMCKVSGAGIEEALEEQEKASQASKPQMADENIHVINLDEEDMDNGLNLNLISHIQNQLQMRTQLGVMTILCVVAFGLNMLSTLHVTTSNIRDFISQKERRRHELMSYLIHTEQCRDIIRMGPETFINLCQQVRATGLVKDAFRSTMKDQVTKFLHIIGHNVKNRSVSFFFHQSGETVSRHFHNVLNAIIMLEGELLVQPSGRDVHPYILDNTRFYPYFKSDESLLAEVDRELMEEDVDTMSTQVREEDYREGSNIRDVIANEMWRDYQNN
ncbi:hypothetical protein Fmac_027577 [Flemingia macrophylla]|uniref:Uncharacterized protein n=1 Tax=Flemingia macrophylla TaxID=520843 RepID=A0ABD1LIC0_9FABA